ncbi:Monooxygenase component MmoB/DmpM [marine gamma proteobacterium HTCC2207]|jgi:phenol hydroxylase P2 protein|uniref:Monooxygenase component MmoB/DmpM n=2 Tax=SAR92 clade TaxID=745004 RepID=Q1YSJ3_9GAMM|nr:Monooxygenase component MmoB/DmpM [marine gamma proteobacterium HTCC2207] [gamma proteobacterium HTCC2207]MBT5560297.1 monooxygenase [Pseudomonadota bacterium]MBT7959425.1 monooxygenase [Akkermansiaceae bacterium]MDB2534246.1 MmoB/DmpM family protein [Porticoccaceae bacterium]UVW35421.1 MmoB/DmpM family protein [SAR92 clade bacterium H455]|tara:strand:+ start:7128 stop:7397 length:270 start_codon:yes stop_codon:yes gene_type:complete
MSRVQIAFQDNDESRYIVAAIEQDNTTAVVHYEPAMIRVENEGSLIINRDTVSEQIGMEWDVQSLHINLITLTGHIDEDDDYFKIMWNN